MKTLFTSLLLTCVLYTFGFQSSKSATVQNAGPAKIEKQRSFKEPLHKKYSDKDFKYKEETQSAKKSNTNTSAFLNFFFFFMSKIFPFLLGGLVIFFLLKVLFGFDTKFWKKQPKNTAIDQQLIAEDEALETLNINALLQKALSNNDYRLAIRYYYLQVLKDLTQQKWIDYHKDKTNTEYIFEIKDKKIQTFFKDLTYIYTYVWYGEFQLDTASFAQAQKKYQTFLTQFA